jgi:hypothetical protein
MLAPAIAASPQDAVFSRFPLLHASERSGNSKSARLMHEFYAAVGGAASRGNASNFA